MQASMKHYYRLILVVMSFGFLNSGLNAQTNAAYQKEIEDWHANRIKELKADDGWLNLVGLYWLDDGQNSFGSGSQNKIVFPKGSIDEVAGYFERSGRR